jgi:hypothetical protein
MTLSGTLPVPVPPNEPATSLRGKQRNMLFWPVFFVVFASISCSFGYQTLHRWDPRTSWHDTRSYYDMVEGNYARTLPPFHHRLLTPWLASNVRKLVPDGLIRTWNPVFLSLLLVNAAFMSLSCLAVVRMAELTIGSRTVGVTAAFLFLTGWATVNGTMCGGVDAAVCLVILAVMLAVMQDRWWLVPVFVAIGSLAKETAMLFSLVFVFTWIGYVGLVKKRWPRPALFAAMISAVVGPLVLRALWYFMAKDVYEAHLPSWTLLAAVPSNFLAFLHHDVLWTWGLLAALGLFRINRLPGPLIAATLAVAIVGLFCSAYAGIRENVARLLYNAVGPFFALSSAIFLQELIAVKPKPRGGDAGQKAFADTPH